jgi:hypothetical protein
MNTRKNIIKLCIIVPVINLFFAFYFYNYGGIKVLAKPDDYKVTFMDCFYFSFTSFFTISYGDMIPYTFNAKIAVLILGSTAYIILVLHLYNLFNIIDSNDL